MGKILRIVPIVAALVLVGAGADLALDGAVDVQPTGEGDVAEQLGLAPDEGVDGAVVGAALGGLLAVLEHAGQLSFPATTRCHS